MPPIPNEDVTPATPAERSGVARLALATPLADRSPLPQDGLPDDVTADDYRDDYWDEAWHGRRG